MILTGGVLSWVAFAQGAPAGGILNEATLIVRGLVEAKQSDRRPRSSCDARFERFYIMTRAGDGVCVKYSFRIAI